MKTNALQRKRLEILLTKVFPIMKKEGKISNFLHNFTRICGTPMCIAGHACVLPEFNIQGLVFLRYIPSFSGKNGLEALDKFFGENAYKMLFCGNLSGFLSDYEVMLNREIYLKDHLANYKGD